MPISRPDSPDAAIRCLVEGNRRFVEARPAAPLPPPARANLANGQSPFATVLGCSDSRVPVEAIFDREPGDLFVVRVAGNFLNEDGLATMEYAVALLNSMLVVVLGHEQCGAVKAALDYVDTDARLPGAIQRLVDAIAPAARATRGTNRWHDAVIENVRRNAAEIPQRSNIVAEAMRAGRLRVAGATYDLRSGVVSFLD